MSVVKETHGKPKTYGKLPKDIKERCILKYSKHSVTTEQHGTISSTHSPKSMFSVKIKIIFLFKLKFTVRSTKYFF